MATLEDYFLIETDKPTMAEEYNENHPSVVDRFFTRFYKIFTDKPGEDHLILFHSNRICLISLAPSHIALRKGVKKIQYDIGNCDRMKNHVSGKGKKGGMNLQSNSTLAIVICNDDSEYKIQSCITGKLIEVNPRLVENPTLVAQEGDGYIAIVLPKVENCSNIKDNLFTKTQYEMLLPDSNKMEQN